MTGFTKQRQVIILDSSSALPDVMYLHLFTGAAEGDEPNEDGTLKAGMAEVSTSGTGYAAKKVYRTQALWVTGGSSADESYHAAAVAGPPSTKQLPAAGAPALTWPASGNFGDLVAWALTINETWAAAETVASGPIVDGSGVAQKVTINTGSSFEFNSNNPILHRMGDPAKVVDASAGSEITVPT